MKYTILKGFACLESPKNPWKNIPDPTAAVILKDERNMESIIHSEKKQKENLVKMKNKPLSLTQVYFDWKNLNLHAHYYILFGP